MMFKKKLMILSLITLIFVNYTSLIYADKTQTSTSLIIYEFEVSPNSSENKVNYLQELLYVFNNKVDKISINQYKRNQLNKYDSVFVINIKKDIYNISFLDDLSSYKNKIYWIGDKVDDYLNTTKKYDIKYKNRNYSINKLFYKNSNFIVEVGNYYNIMNPSENSQVLSTMSDNYNDYPFVIKENNLYYISRWDLDSSYIFEDTLNNFYDIESFPKEEIFIRIEDVHPFSDTNKLRNIADYLYSENVPFMIALIPTYIDNTTKKINTLDSNPEFIETIKYMQDKGGSVVLHGYTHQLGTEEISGEGYEFWDMKTDSPIDDDIQTYIKNRILSGLRLCIENEIYPLAFEAPHYAINIDGYKEIKKYFSTYVGQYQNNNNNFATNSSPFIIKDSDSFNILIPENLGFVDEDNEFSIDLIKSNYKKLSMVDGHNGGFFFHPYLDLNYLKEMISFFKDNNVNFMDLKDKDNYVKIDDISITSNKGKIESSYDYSKSISTNKEPSSFDNFIQNINNVVITFISIILIIFIIIFIIFKRINTRKFTRR